MGAKKKTYVEPGTGADIKISRFTDINDKYHRVALAFINNGCRQTLAYKTVFNCSMDAARQGAYRLFKKPKMIEAIRLYMAGVKNPKLTKEWALKTWQQMIETNVLDYMDDDGRYLTVKELRELPLYVQRAIKKIDVHTRNTDKENEDGTTTTTTTQRVSIELVDKQKALSDMARAEKWIETHMTINNNQNIITADSLIEAAQRREAMLKHKKIDDPAQIERRPIEGEAERMENDG